MSSAGTKSSATVQQMQPFASSTISSSVQFSTPQLRRISPSMPTSPNSLTMIARRLSPAPSSRLRISVVLPAPRKPVTTVQGTRSKVWLMRLILFVRAGSSPWRGLRAWLDGRDFRRRSPAKARTVAPDATRRNNEIRGNEGSSSQRSLPGTPAGRSGLQIDGRSPGFRIDARAAFPKLSFQWRVALASRLQLRGQLRNCPEGRTIFPLSLHRCG